MGECFQEKQVRKESYQAYDKRVNACYMKQSTRKRDIYPLPSGPSEFPISLHTDR